MIANHLIFIDCNMNFKSYLKYLNTIDYPKQTENLLEVSRYLSYGPEEFQNDLLSNLGVVGTADFVGKTFKKLGLMSSPGYKVNLDNTAEKGSYVHLIINSFEIIETKEDGELPFHVWINYSWGDNKIIHDDETLTIKGIYDEIGMGEWGEWDEFMDSVQDDVKYEIYKQTEFFLHFDAQW